MPKTQKPPKEKKIGRPSGFTQAIADDICLRLQTPIEREDGSFTCPSLREILATIDGPHMSMVMRWLAEFEPFREQYRAAREAQAELRADEVIDIGEENPLKTTTYTTKGGGESVTEEVDGAGIQRNKLRCDNRKWAASKMYPKKYGEKSDLNVNAGADLLQLIQASITPGAKAKKKAK